MHFALDTVETLPTKPDEASRADFRLSETERFQSNAQALDRCRDNQ